MVWEFLFGMIPGNLQAGNNRQFLDGCDILDISVRESFSDGNPVIRTAGNLKKNNFLSVDLVNNGTVIILMAAFPVFHTDYITYKKAA